MSLDMLGLTTPPMFNLRCALHVSLCRAPQFSLRRSYFKHGCTAYRRRTLREVERPVFRESGTHATVSPSPTPLVIDTRAKDAVLRTTGHFKNLVLTLAHGCRLSWDPQACTEATQQLHPRGNNARAPVYQNHCELPRRTTGESVASLVTPCSVSHDR